jgi:uncharacterized metal-binding protein
MPGIRRKVTFIMLKFFRIERRRSPNSNFMKKRILIVLYLLYILIINHTFIIANRVTLLK